LLISLAYSFAEVPCKINYQGRLIKDNVPVDGTKTMRFSIYDSAVGPTLLWTSGDVSVEVHNGLFRYVLDLSSIDDWSAGQALYLEVIVDGETLTPREELSAYPYAINSHLLEGETKEYFLNTSGETQTKQGNLNIIGNVGIGTASHGARLDVQGEPNNAQGGISLGTLNAQSGWVSSPEDLNFVVDNTNRIQDRSFFFRDGTAGFVLMTIQENGNVGIGTASPGAKLEVQGGSIRATGGLIIETRTTDPTTTPATGQTWLRTDINP